MFGLGIFEILLLVIIIASALVLFRVVSTRYQNQTEFKDREIRKLAFVWGNFWILSGFVSSGVILLVLAGAFGQPIKPIGSEDMSLLLVISVLALGSAVGLSMRKRFGLYVAYASLALMSLGGIGGLLQGTGSGAAQGIFAIITAPLWFRYFRKRKGWFQ